ncbi:MAG: OsmC family protein [Pseudomonadota bacterium]
MNVQSPLTADNGVNVDALLGARQAITDMPAAGQFTWRATCEWQTGVQSRSIVEGFFGLGEEQERGAAFMIDADHPAQFAAGNAGATPLEIALSALASCLTAGVASVAQNRGIQLHKVTAHVEGDMDLAGVLGADADVRNGFSDIRVTFDIDADASEADIAALVAQSQKRSAVFDVITNPTNVSVSVA